MGPEFKRQLFVDLIIYVAKKNCMKWSQVLNAFLGQELPRRDPFRRQLETIRHFKRGHGSRGSRSNSKLSRYHQDRGNSSSIASSLILSPEHKQLELTKIKKHSVSTNKQPNIYMQSIQPSVNQDTSHYASVSINSLENLKRNKIRRSLV